VKQSLGLAHAGRAGVVGRAATAAVCQASAFALLRGAASAPVLAATVIANIKIKMRVISASYRVIGVPIEAAPAGHCQGCGGRPSLQAGLPAEAAEPQRLVGDDGLEPPTSCV
jgi:hypothetical protein